MKKILLFFINSLFFKKCLFCDNKHGFYLCKNCFSSIRFKEQTCLRCGALSDFGEFCKKCKKHFNYQGVMVAGDFKDLKLAKLIKLFKYDFIKEIGQNLALFLSNFLREKNEINPILKTKNKQKFNSNNSLIIFTPLSKKRQRWRGFNQSQILAEFISKKHKIPIFYGLRKIKITENQANLTLEERKNNLKNCFEFTEKELARKNIKDKKIIIVDDVATSGSTIEEISQEIKKYQPKEIWGLVLAHG